MINYFYDSYVILNKVYSEKTFIKQAINNTVIEEKNRAITVKICYGVLDKDIELSYYLSSIAKKTPKLSIRTILKIAMYCVKYLNKKEYAVTENAVELTKKLGKSGASGFVNAFMRKFINDTIPLPSDVVKRLSVEYSYPEFAVRELLNKYDVSRLKSILSSENINTCLCFYGVDGREYLQSCKIDYTNTPFYNVYFAKNFIRNKDYDKGLYTYQALGSVAICDIVEPCNEILDCCAAPGGKSVRLSYKCNKVVSTDLHEHRVMLINEYANRMNRTNIETFTCDSKILQQNFVERFDAVLCDVPCSGLGVVNDNPDIKLNRDEASIKSLCLEQISILKNACKYVKVGGYLYYSTCSILDCENIDIIDTFMSDITGFEIVEIDSKLQHEDIRGTNLFMPDISCGLGFFVAKLKRVK